MADLLPDAPLLAYQLVPAVTAMCVVGGVFFLLARRGAPKRLLDRKVEPLAATPGVGGVPVVVIVGGSRSRSSSCRRRSCHAPSPRERGALRQ